MKRVGNGRRVRIGEMFWVEMEVKYGRGKERGEDEGEGERKDKGWRRRVR